MAIHEINDKANSQHPQQFCVLTVKETYGSENGRAPNYFF